jgi:hypothetical protein
MLCGGSGRSLISGGRVVARWCHWAPLEMVQGCYDLAGLSASVFGFMVLFLLASKEWLLRPGVPGARPCIIVAVRLAGGHWMLEMGEGPGVGSLSQQVFVTGEGPGGGAVSLLVVQRRWSCTPVIAAVDRSLGDL